MMRNLIVLAGVLFASSVAAQAPDPDPTRFAQDIARFERWDSQNSFPPDAVLFVGSSSIVGWNTAERFPGMPVINRGFGGSQISDILHYLPRTVLRFDADVIVFYCGNNDIFGGKDPSQVLEDYQEFVQRVRGSGSDADILFISVHPSMARWAHWPAMKELNARVKAWSGTQPGLHYAEVATPMLGDDGRPRAELFVEDGLHLNAAGYDVWGPVVAEVLRRVRSIG